MRSKKEKKEMVAAEQERRWQAWLQGQGSLLLTLQLPEVILRSEEHWNDFCSNGALDLHPHESAFTARDIDPIHGEQLLLFLETYLTAEEKPYSALYQVLKQRFRPDED